MTTTNYQLIKTLSHLGFHQNDARVYLAALELGPSSVWQIYQKSGIKRPTCYLILDKFVSEGLATKTFDSKKTIYSVVEPTDLLHSLDHKKKKFKEHLPQFEALLNKTIQKPEIQLYQGLEGVKQAYYLSLKNPDSIVKILGNAKIWLDNPEENNFYIQERLKQNISLQILFSDLSENKKMLLEDIDKLRETRFLPKTLFNPPIETHIFANSVIYIAHSEKEPFATVIKNPSIYLAENQKFDLLWTIAHK